MRLSSAPTRPVSSGVDCFDSSRVVEIAKLNQRKVGQQQVVLACGFDGAREVPTECIRRKPPRRILHLVAASRYGSNVPPATRLDCIRDELATASVHHKTARDGCPHPV